MENYESNKDINEEGKIITDGNKIKELNSKIQSLYIEETKDSECIISIIQISKIESQNENIPKSICQIKIETRSETLLELGFLLKFMIEQECFYCFIYNGNENNKIINSNNKISIYFNDELKALNLKTEGKKRYIKCLIDIGLNINIIEIIKEDNISKDYFLLNEYETDNNRLINSQICISKYIKGKELVNCKGKIININKYEFIYTSSIECDLSGSPIFLENNFGIFGIHKGIDEDKKENHGYLIYPIINIITIDINKRRNTGRYINDKYIWEDDKYYLGEYKDNMPNGKGIKYYPNGNILYEGNFINGKFDGKGKYYYDNGMYFIGEYKNGLRNGKGIQYYKNGNIIFEGDWINDRREGFGKYIWEDGSYYIGQFKNSLKHGKGIMYDSNGIIEYEGEYINDEKEGTGKDFYENGEYYIGQLKKGTRHGRGIYYYSNGNIKYDGDFINEKREGNGKYIWENNEYYIGKWENDSRNGKGIEYYSNGNIKYEGEFINGKCEGDGKYFLENGEYYIGQFRNGVKNGKGTEYYSDKKLKFKGNYISNEKNGIGHYISENDEYYIGQFMNGVKHGKGTLYLPNGKIKQEGNWFFGIFTGN